MANTLNKSLLVLLFAASASFGAVAADDATMHQVYEAANSGHLDQARGMMAQVLKDHPNSAKAHYVAAEIDARSGDLGAARSELQTAERIEPGLPFAKAASLQELRQQLYPEQAQRVQPRVITQPAYQSAAQPRFPWATVLGIGLVVWIVWLIFRRRQQAAAPLYGGGGYGNGPAPGGYSGGYPPPAGGGLMGSLGTGLAVGAGVVAGEEIAHRLLDGNGQRVVERDVAYRDDPPSNPNADMGGTDFGVSDSSSWDDGGGSADSGGGDDWS